MDNDFLEMVVQITATLMGFAFLGPMIQVTSAESFERLRTYMRMPLIYKRILTHGSFALCIFFWPFLSSLLLLNCQSNTMEMIIKIASIVAALTVLLWHWRIIIPTRARPQCPILVDITFWHIPRIALLIYVCYAGVAFRGTLASFFQWTVLAFIALGILFLVDSILTPISKALTLKTSDLSSEFGKEVNKCFKDITNALEARERQVQRLKSLRPPSGKEMEWHFKIAEYRSKITFFRKHYEAPYGLKDDWEKIEKELASKEGCTLSHLSTFDDRKERILEEYFPEFERVTEEIELLFGKVG